MLCADWPCPSGTFLPLCGFIFGLQILVHQGPCGAEKCRELRESAREVETNGFDDKARKAHLDSRQKLPEGGICLDGMGIGLADAGWLPMWAGTTEKAPFWPRGGVTLEAGSFVKRFTG